MSSSSDMSPEAVAFCDRVLSLQTSMRPDGIHTNSFNIIASDGIVFEIVMQKQCAHTFLLKASIPDTYTNMALGFGDVFVSQGFWLRFWRRHDDDDDADDGFHEGKPFARQEIKNANTVDDQRRKVLSFMETVKNVRVCTCRKLLILDGADVCFNCDFERARKGASALSERGTCPVCREAVTTDDATACCNKPVHAACLAKWLDTSSESKCPLCRGAAKRSRTSSE